MPNVLGDVVEVCWRARARARDCCGMRSWTPMCSVWRRLPVGLLGRHRTQRAHVRARARAHARTRARTQATSTEAAALCSIDVTSENDECDDGCSDSAETCTIMDKALSSVIEASDRCRAFKSGMEELENSKQRQASCPCREYEILCEYVTVSPGQEGSSSCLPKAAESGIMRG